MSAGTQQLELDDYRRDIGAAARRSGEERSASADPDGVAEARAIVLELVDAGYAVSADDVRPYQRVGTPQVLGVVFAGLRREGLIVPDGIAISRAPSRHGSIQRRWRAAP